VLEVYSLPPTLRHQMEVLLEIRNEIIHPSPKPFSACPPYILELQAAGVLESRLVGSGTSLLARIGTHKFFQWAAIRCRELLHCVVESDDRKPMYAGLASNLDWVYES